MKIRSSEITMSAVHRHQYPTDGIPEIALAGRSNVGKSSLTNVYLTEEISLEQVLHQVRQEQ